MVGINKTQRMIKSMKSSSEVRTPVATDIYLPNYSAIKGASNLGTAGSVLFYNGEGRIDTDNSNFFWDNTNKRLGIGTTPSVLLHAKSTSSNVPILRAEAASHAEIQIKRTGNALANGRIQFIGSANAVDWEMLCNNRGGTHNLDFEHEGTSVLMLRDGPLVGIGTTSPNNELHVHKTAGSVTIQAGTSAFGATSQLKLGDGTNSNTWGLISQTNYLQFTRNTASLGRWTTTGLGIGEDTPSQRLHVTGSNSPQILIEESSTEFVRIGVEATGGDVCIGWDDSDDMHLGVFSSPTDDTISTKLLISSGGDVTVHSGNLIKNAFEILSTTSGIIADVTVTQGVNTITTGLYEVATVAIAGESITMPVIVTGMKIVVINNGDNAVGVFPNVGHQIDGGGVNTAVNQAAGTTGIYHAWDGTNWKKIEG